MVLLVGHSSWFQNPTSKVSAHYVVEQDGSVVQMVSEDDTAWHNGKYYFHSSSSS